MCTFACSRVFARANTCPTCPDASKEVKELLKSADVARLVRDIDAAKDPHTALALARANPQVANDWVSLAACAVCACVMWHWSVVR